MVAAVAPELVMALRDGWGYDTLIPLNWIHAEYAQPPRCFMSSAVNSREDGLSGSASNPVALRVCHVLPGPDSPHRMVFAREQISSLSALGVINHSVFLQSRTSPQLVFREARRLHRVMEEFRPQVVHSHYGTVTALITALCSRAPMVITYRGSDLNPCPSISPLRSALGRLLSQIAAYRAARIVCVSADLKRKLWRGGDGIRIISTGVNLATFRPASRETSRRELGWPFDRKVVLFNAGDDPQVKRKDLAAAAVAEARKLSLDFDFIELDGRVDHRRMPIYLNAADCLLVTSDWEGSPNIVKEAIACDLPVVAVEVGDVRARLAKVTPSRIVERTPASIASGLVAILNQSGRSNGHETIGDVSSDTVAQQIVALYREALAR